MSSNIKQTIGLFTANSQSGSSALSTLLARPDAETRLIKAICRARTGVEQVKTKVSIPEKLLNNVEFVEGVDATDEESMIKAFAGLDGLLIVTPVTPDRGELAAAAVRAASAAKVKRIAIAGSYTIAIPAQICQDHFGPQEAAARELFPGRACILRSGFYSTNLFIFAGTVKKDNVIYGPFLPDVKITFLDPEDIGACGAVALAEDDKEYEDVTKIVNVCGPEALSMTEVAALLSKELGREIKYVGLPVSAVQEGMRGAGVPENVVSYVEIMAGPINEGITSTVYGEVEKMTGRRSTLENFLHRHIEAFK
jgi:NAD(P)H dehydrogenase (quinone)